MDAVDKAIEYLTCLPKNQETSVFECFGNGARMILEADCSRRESFYLFHEFDAKRKQEKIRIHRTQSDLPIGMPWVGHFYKV